MTPVGAPGDRSIGDREWLAAALERVSDLGFTVDAIEQVALSLSHSRAQGLRQLAIVELAKRDVSTAIVYALALDPSAAWTAALQRVAAIAADSGPEVILHLASLIPIGSERALFVEQVLNAWVLRNPEAIFDFLEATGVVESTVSAATLAALASTEPERVRSILDGLPPGIRTQYEPAVIDTMLDRDPGSAYFYADARSLGPDRDRLLRMVASRHSQRNPEEALSYILTVDSLPVMVVDNVLATVAAEDLPYALDQAIETLISGQNHEQEPAVKNSRLAMLIAAAARSGSTGISAAVDLIANHPDQRVRRSLNGYDAMDGLLGRWAAVDPEGAKDWTLRNPAKVSPGFVAYLGQLSAAASGDATGAQQSLNALPEDLRGYWMAGVAEGLASSSLDAAVAWLATVRGAPVYTTVMDRVLSSAASTQPTAVAQVIDGLPDPPDSGLVLNLATAWGSQQPGEAGDWLAASQNIDDDLRAEAVRQIVLGWAARDLRDAEIWVQDLPRGPFRDSALAAMLPEAAASRALDSRFLGAFSSEMGRMQGLVEAMDALRRTEPDLGRSLIDRYISDPELRDLAERRLEGRAGPLLNDRLFRGAVVR